MKAVETAFVEYVQRNERKTRQAQRESQDIEH